MHKVDTAGATANDTFVDKDPVNDIPGTVVDADWLNAVQGELVKVIEAAGITLSKGDHSQLYTAILRAGGKVFPSYTEAQAFDVAFFQDGQTVYVAGRSSAGDGAEGPFRWDSSDLSTEVAADEVTAGEGDGGVFLAPAIDKTGASGALVRLDLREILPQWYVGNATGDVTPKISLAAARSDGIDHLPIVKNYTVGDLILREVGLRGRGTLTAATGATSVLNLGQSSEGWRFKLIQDVEINGNGKASDGVRFDADDQMSGRWVFERPVFRDCLAGVRKAQGNIGNTFHDATWENADFGYHAVNADPETMHAGSDYIIRGHIRGCDKAAVYIKSQTLGTGQFVMDGTIVESNDGFGLFVENFGQERGLAQPMELRNVWFEKNATVASVDIDGTTYTPKTIHLKNTIACLATATHFAGPIELANSALVADACNFDGDTELTIDDNSSLIIRNALTDSLEFNQQHVLVESLMHPTRQSGTFADSYATLPRSGILYTIPFGPGRLLRAKPFNGTSSYTLSGTGSLTSTQVTHGLLYEYVAEFSQPDGGAHLLHNAIAAVSDKWYVITFDFKPVTGIPTKIYVTGSSTFVQGWEKVIDDEGVWYTMATVVRADPGSDTSSVRLRIENDSGAEITWQIGSLQFVEFDSMDHAVQFFNSRAYAAG